MFNQLLDDKLSSLQINIKETARNKVRNDKYRTLNQQAAYSLFTAKVQHDKYAIGEDVKIASRDKKYDGKPFRLESQLDSHDSPFIFDVRYAIRANKHGRDPELRAVARQVNKSLSFISEQSYKNFEINEEESSDRLDDEQDQHVQGNKKQLVFSVTNSTLHLD